MIVKEIMMPCPKWAHDDELWKSILEQDEDESGRLHFFQHSYVKDTYID